MLPRRVSIHTAAAMTGKHPPNILALVNSGQLAAMQSVFDTRQPRYQIGLSRT
jgi:hypothetical protein